MQQKKGASQIYLRSIQMRRIAGTKPFGKERYDYIPGLKPTLIRLKKKIVFLSRPKVGFNPATS